MKSKKISLALLITFLTLAIAPIARAADIPLLSWERGKQQSIVLGGPSTGSGWKIFLIAQGQEDRAFTPSVPNKAGYIVYSIDLPRDLPLGGYSVEARAQGSPDTSVAAINVVERNFYTISSIPTDLRLLFTFYAIIISTFAIIRARKYSSLTFTRDKSHRRIKGEQNETSRVPRIFQPFYKFRSRRQAEMEISFLKFIAYKDGEALHKLSPIAWAVLPFATLLLGMYMSWSIQATTVIPNVAISLIIAAAVIGAFDAISGATAAAGFIFASLILGDVNGMRAFISVVAFTLAWWGPSMLATMYLLTLTVDFKEGFAKLSPKLKNVLTLILSAIFGSTAIMISAILTDSLVINIQGSSFTRWPLMAIVAGVILIKHVIESFIDSSRVRKSKTIESVEESIFLARVISPSMTFMVSVAIFGITYVWTEKAVQAFIATLIISAPLFLSFMVFPEVAGKRFPMIRRNLILETIVMSAITIGVYMLIQRLPMATREKGQAFILLGLVPVLIHAIYSALVVSSERAKSSEGEVNV